MLTSAAATPFPSARPTAWPTRIGLGLTTLGVAAGLLIVFLALPPFQIGWWFQSEPVTAGLHGVSALTALGLALMAWGGHRRTLRSLTHPFVLLPAALGLWSLAVSPFDAMPQLSLFGTPELGEGAIWFLDLATLIAGGLMVMRIRRLRQAVGWFALASTLAVTGLTLHTQAHWAWAPFWFYDYLAFFAVDLVVIVLTMIRPRRSSMRWLTVLLGLAIIVISGNRAAIALAVTAVPATWSVLWLVRRRERLCRWLAVIAAILAPLAATAAVYAVGSRGMEAAIESRYLHQIIASRTLASDPTILLTGQGWGHHADSVVAHMPIERIDLQGFAGTADWDGVRRQVHFHSHNFLIESLLASGIIGLLLAWALPISVPLCCRRREIRTAGVFAAMVTALSALWFQLPGSVPFFALAIAGLAKVPMPSPTRRAAVMRPLIAAVLVIVTCVQGFAARDTLVVAAEASEAIRANTRATEPGGPTVSNADCAALLDDHGRGGIHLSVALRRFSDMVEQRTRQGAPPTQGEAVRFADLLCAADSRLAKGASLRLQVAVLLVTTDLVFALKEPSLDSVRSRLVAQWPERLDSFLRKAPGRSDIAYLYLTWLNDRGETAAVRQWAGRLLTHNRHDPVGLWFSGSVMILDPATASEGLKRLVESLDGGIKNVLAVDDATERTIRDAAAAR
ncbi:MAG: hypothetical protein CMM50_13655 [Rhodospirillaceae bacterium]|nr:hypothetical protein [Rhodospirillaceae bacterium]